MLWFPVLIISRCVQTGCVRACRGPSWEVEHFFFFSHLKPYKPPRGLRLSYHDIRSLCGCTKTHETPPTHTHPPQPLGDSRATRNPPTSRSAVGGEEARSPPCFMEANDIQHSVVVFLSTLVFQAMNRADGLASTNGRG